MRKVYDVALDIIELYLPAVTFVIMFVVFVLEIFFRYVLDSPLEWAYEVTVLAFIWTTLLAACYMHRKQRHIIFSMFYDRRSPATQRIFRLLGNGLLFAACAASFWPTLDYVTFITSNKSPVLRLPFSVGFFPILVFVVLIGVHSLEQFIADLRRPAKAKEGAA